MSFFGFQIQCTEDAVIPGKLAVTDDVSRKIVFDHTIVSDPTPEPLIKHENGDFTITQAGNFFISWFITLKTGLGDTGAEFSLIAETYTGTGGTLLETTYFPCSNSMKTGQLAGSALIQINESEKCILRLCNMSDYEATLSTNTSVKANVSIHQFLVGSYSSSYGLVSMTLKLTAAGQSSTELTYQEPILFNLPDIPSYATSIYGYNQGTGVFTMKKGGNFLLNWSVSLDGSQDADAISFTLQSVTGGVTTDIDTFDNTLLMQNTYSGFTSFQATAGQTFKFVNTSKKTDPVTAAVTGASLTYSKIPTRAVLRIVGHN